MNSELTGPKHNLYLKSHKYAKIRFDIDTIYFYNINYLLLKN